MNARKHISLVGLLGLAAAPALAMFGSLVAATVIVAGTGSLVAHFMH